MNYNDEIVSIEYIGVRKTIDIDVESKDHLFYANGILTHNSAVDETDFDHSHISGGISKINTADNVFGILTNNMMRERGKYQLQLMKTRSSAGVGQKIELDFDINSLRITDAGDTYTANSPTSNEIMQNLKTTTSVNSDGTVQTSSTGRVSGSIDSSKVKGLLAKIKN
jgi:hypothetical protein